MPKDSNNYIDTNKVSEQYKGSRYIWPISNTEYYQNSDYLQNIPYNSYYNKIPNDNAHIKPLLQQPLRFNPKYRYIRPNLNPNNNLNAKYDLNKEDKKNSIIENPQLDKIFKKTSKIIDNVLFNNQDSYLIKDSTNFVNSNDRIQNLANLNKVSDIKKQSKTKSIIIKPSTDKINKTLKLKNETNKIKDKLTVDLTTKKRKNSESEIKNIRDKMESKKIKKMIDHKNLLSETSKINSANKSIFSFPLKANKNQDKNNLKNQAVKIMCYNKAGIPLPSPNKKFTNNLFIFGTPKSTDFYIPEKSFNSIFNISSNKNNDTKAKSLNQSNLNENIKDDNIKLTYDPAKKKKVPTATLR